MRAAVYERTGPAREVLRIVEQPDPTPAAGEVRVRVHVSGVNPTDWKARGRPGPVPFPQKTPNQDGAGVIDAVGDGVDPSRVGTRVWIYNAAFQRAGGSAAQYVCLPSRQAVELPDGVSFEQGAGIGVPYLTAYHCLTVGGGHDATVLVTGGAGAVGHATIQLARRTGARVLTTVSSAEKAALAREAGAHEVVNYRDEDAGEQLVAAAPDGIDRTVDVSLQDNLAVYAPALAQHAHVASYASTPDAELRWPLELLRARNVTLHLMLLYWVDPSVLDAGARLVTQALREGALRALPHHVFELDEIAAAHEAVEQGAVGKVLVRIP